MDVVFVMENVTKSKEQLLSENAMLRNEVESLRSALAKKSNLSILDISNIINFRDGRLLVPPLNNINEILLAEESLRESEFRFRSLLEDVQNVAVQGYGPDGTTQYWNKASELLYGYSSKEAIGRSLIELIIPPEMRGDVQTAISQMAQTGKSIPSSELLLMKKDGSRVAVFSSHTIINLPGRPPELFCIDIDLTEQKRSEAELNKYRNHLEELVRSRTEELKNTNDELTKKIVKEQEYQLMLKQSLEKEKELNEMKSTFISITSHEFRTPLTSVLSSAELLQLYAGKWSDEKKSKYLDKIKNSVIYLTKLLDDVLTISRAETGKLDFHPDMLDLNQLSEDCIHDATSLLTGKHELIFNFNAEQKHFRLDPKLMKFILSNLLSNAIKYSPEGGLIGLDVSAGRDTLIIEVKDEGIGIPQLEISKIFESFYRSPNSEYFPGTGLGLAIVKRAVDLHGGEIHVNSSLGSGTTFTVRIPLNT